VGEGRDILFIFGSDQSFPRSLLIVARYRSGFSGCCRIERLFVFCWERGGIFEFRF
jgi:hypothetical protein